MKFFIPASKSPEQEKKVYEEIKTFLHQELDAKFSERRVRILQWKHDGNQYEAEVGKTTSFNGEIVIAILYENGRDLYHVCTPNRGVLRGGSILAGGQSVFGNIDFDSD
ncbi:hypothetical protein B9G53_00365 [Pseudanabaena sp. SR411]|uniref:hypothetical protein n=1 Tax=Pseudanabaena sp. SR411 TaxID=1980935 RepID=UPI000B99C1CA|nr:hypothetical protein [Pseudanabaena sp. SR411]OYQ68016.1 hypothetical protein B9G53_00365 [Pseudanabaena sp. SR411]